MLRGGALQRVSERVDVLLHKLIRVLDGLLERCGEVGHVDVRAAPLSEESTGLWLERLDHELRMSALRDKAQADPHLDRSGRDEK